MKVQSVDVLQDDRILLTNLGFFGFHGVMLQENALGQRFFIDSARGVDLGESGRTDSLDSTVSCADIYGAVKEAFEQKRFKLMEALGQHVVDFLLAAFPTVDWIRIAVSKPRAPIAMVSGEAAIEITRSHGDA